jgi:hypothetical protein
MNLKIKIRILNAISTLFLFIILCALAFVIRIIDFKNHLVAGFIIMILTAYGASNIMHKIQSFLWKKYIRKLKEKYEQSKASTVNQDAGSN